MSKINKKVKYLQKGMFFFAMLLVTVALIGCGGDGSGTTATVEGVSIDGGDTGAMVGTNKTLTATVSPNNVTDSSVTWKSINTAVATINSDGVVTPKIAGTTMITVTTTDGNHTDTITLTVSTGIVSVEGVSIDGDATRTATVGDAAVQLIATVTMSDTTTNSEVFWLSSNEDLATVDDDGLVTFVAAGEVDITATSTVDTTQTATVPFSVNPAVTSVTIDGDATRTATVSATDVQLTATVTMSDTTTNSEVFWLSSDEDLATVDDDGLMDFVAEGSVFITATSMVDDTKMATVTFTVTYAIGSTGPAGGIIFYINPDAATDGWTYLEASRNDQSRIIGWGGFGTPVGTSRNIGTGEANTDQIVTVLTTNGEVDITTYAAGLCSEYSTTVDGNTFDDWFLPSYYELEELYKHKATVGGFVFNGYWSSSGYSANTASRVSFYNGAGYLNNSKEITYCIRAVRAF